MLYKTFILILPIIFLTLSQPPVMATTEEKQNTLLFELPPLPYSYNALEPYIDTRTMEIHHDCNHRGYVDNLNKAVKGTEWEGKTLEELLMRASQLPLVIRNNAGGDWNHSFNWLSMTEDKKKRQIPDRVEKELTKFFGSVAAFKEAFRNASLSRFGSGNAWLIRTKTGALKVCSLPNQDNPLMDDCYMPGTPLLICDVWEHAYYLKYINRRDNYFDAIWNVLNWDHVDKLMFPE